MSCSRTVQSPADGLRAGRWLRDRYGFTAAMVKLDADGITVVGPGVGRHVPTRPRQVCDVIGAGDMVLAVVGLCQAAGWGLVETAELANVAAGLEVEKLGIAPVSSDKIRMRHGSPKIVSLDAMPRLAESYRAAGKTVVFTNGCFDLLHVEHVGFLQEAAKLGDVPIVAINSDDSVGRLKGAVRPIVGQHDCAAMLAALTCVDHVVVFDEYTPNRILEHIPPDVLVKAGTTREVVGRALVESYGARVCVAGRVGGVSTRELVGGLKRKCTLDGASFGGLQRGSGRAGRRLARLRAGMGRDSVGGGTGAGEVRRGERWTVGCFADMRAMSPLATVTQSLIR